jgi:hypothetical protein
MARRLIAEAKSQGQPAPGAGSVVHNIYRWERGDGVSPRYVLLYCAVFGISPKAFPGRRGPGAGAGPRPASPGDIACGMQVPDTGDRDTTVGQEVRMAANDGSDHASDAEQRGIGDATLAQFRADVARLSREYMTGEPVPLFKEMRRVRDRMQDAAGRRIWPADTADLYLLLGCLNCLMAAVADDLGYPDSAEELLRAAWAYALVIDHGPLKAKIRADLAAVAYWRGQPQRSLGMAQEGLQHLAAGPNASQLHLKLGRAAATLGDAGAARRAIGLASDARELRSDDDVLHLGGEFGFSQASQCYLAGSVLLDIPGAAPDAVTELERATELYAAGPQDGEDHSAELRMLAHIDLAAALLRSGELDGVGPAIAPVLALPAARRIDPLPQRLGIILSELAGSRYQGSPQASALAGEIQDFTRDTIAGTLGDLSG